MANNNSNLAFDVCNAYENVSIEEEEEGGLIVEGDDVDEGEETKIDFRYCLVGRFLTDKVINFSAMKNTMASLWRPGKGACIKDLSSTLFLFQFSTKLILIGCWKRGHGLLISIYYLSNGWRKMSNLRIFHYSLRPSGYKSIIYQLDLCQKRF